MDHPHIAKVFDGGTTPAGRPYFVMELVKGLPLTDYCDRNGLPIRERLGLFVDVCQAVQHAHQKGIIHRDLKPSNVLVVSHDGTPVSKVIDFGIAKAIGQHLTDKTIYTQLAQLIGTPLYMSPEQAGQSGLDVDTRSDIYSLGVLLYELLTGTTPFDEKRLREVGYDELRRIIWEEEPPRPSTRISTLGQAAATVSTQRKSDPKQLSRLFRGELDWIVMKALEKDRNRRYETANGFAADVQRYLNDEPVQAYPPSAWYRFRKFARRNKTGLAVAALILLVIAVLGGVGGWVAFDRAAREQRLTTQVELILDEVDRLEREQKWPEALAAAKRAEAALAGGEAGDAIRQRVRDVLRDLAFVARLDRIRQSSAATVGGGFNYAGAARDYALAFRDYGVNVEALPVAAAVARLRAKPALAIPVAAALDDWVVCRTSLGEDAPSWKPLIAVARGLDPEPLRDQLRATWGRPLTPDLQGELRQLAESIDVKTLSPASLSVLVGTLRTARLPESAVRVLRDGQYTYPADFWLTFYLGNELFARRDAESVRYFTAAVSLRPDSSFAHSGLGAALGRQGKLDEAIAENRKAIALDPKNAAAHSNLGVPLLYQGRLDEASAEFHKAIELDAKNAAAHCGLGGTLLRQKKTDEAIIECRKAIELDPNVVEAHSNLGLVLMKQGELDKAITEFHKAIELDPKYAEAHANLASALDDKGDLEGAVAEHRKAIALDAKNAAFHSNLGGTLLRQKKTHEAIIECRKAIELDPKFAMAHDNLGIGLCEQGKLDEGIAEHRQAIALDPKYARAHSNLAITLAEQGKLDEAGAEYRQTIALQPDYAPAHCGLGNVLLRQGELRRALEEYRRGHELGSHRPGWRYPSAEWVRQCERLVELDGKLPSILKGETKPANTVECLELALMCLRCKQLNRAAAQLFAQAFAEQPKRADDLGAQYRYKAALAAALAGCGQGKDVDQSDAKERTRLRCQALDWLRADLAAWGRLLEKEPKKTAPVLAATMQHWQQDTDFAGVRGPEVLAKLPEAERVEWQRLWADVADMLKRAQGKPGPEKK
jgi:tetratricopeptide (TPR) repeat protein